jgi:hypothetical protein
MGPDSFTADTNSGLKRHRLPIPKPGNGAPETGGESGDVPVALVGGGALLVGAALVAGGAASPGGHPSVTSTRAGGPPKRRPARRPGLFSLSATSEIGTRAMIGALFEPR